jgi:hypothetical protein
MPTKSSEVVLYCCLLVQYDIYSTDVIENVQWETDYNFRLLQELSASVTSTAIVTQAVFPNFTQPHFEIFAGYTDGFGGILSTAYAPIITDQQREQWEQYASSNTWWIDKSNELRVVHPGHLDQTHEHYLKDEQERAFDVTLAGEHKSHKENVVIEYESGHNISASIFRWENGTLIPEKKHATNVYAPLWQVTPPDPRVINQNLLSDKVVSELYSVMIAMNRSVQSSFTTVNHLFDFAFDDNSTERKFHPYTYIAEPVYDTFSNSPEIVGLLLAIAPFDNLFDNLLPKNTQGIFCVVSSNCGNKISYEINGPDVTFVGYGDLHDTKYDKYKRSSILELYETIVEGLCYHEVHVYPSSTFTQKYFTNNPGLYAFIVAFLSF